MNCEEAIKRMPGYLDGELDPLNNEAIEQHLSSCARCDRAYEAERALAMAIQRSAPYDKAPPQLQARIQASLLGAVNLGSAHEKDVLVTPKTPESRSVFSGTPWSWLAVAAAIVLTAIVTLNLRPHGTDQFLATQLIASHARSLMANHLSDVLSSDQHTVKPWLDQKLDFGTPAIDLSAEGFPMVGGRLDYLNNRAVVALVYQRRKHFINLFIWPAGTEAESAPSNISRQGYQLVHWTDQDFTYWAVSDVNVGDLQEFKQLFQTKLSRR